MDLSYSMKDDLENIKKLGNDLLAALRNITKSVKIGFGSFVDKTVLPYVSTVPAKLRNPCPDRYEQCDSPVSFRHVLPLTDNASEFESRVSQQRISGNLDSPEGGFDAIMQAAVCEEQIGWRNVTRLLVFTSDDVFHTAGDGKLGGIYLPNDNQCHLDTDGLYSKSHIYDYPSVGHLAQVLSASNIQPIFAVTGSTLPVYQELSRLIPKSVVGELKEDSSNVVQLISDAYNSLSSTVNLEHFQLPPGVSVAYESHCEGANHSLGGHGGVCSGVHINQLVSFTVKVQADACLEGPHTFALRVLGFTEEVRVELQTLCDCPCGQPEPNATHCSGGHGTLTCGVCRDCADCQAFRMGPLSQNCSIACNHTVATVVPEATVNEHWCKEKTDDERILIFLIEGMEGGKVALKVKDKDAVTDQTSMIVLGLVLGIVVIGLLVIIAYRISVEILDRREYMRFEKEREQAKGNEVNNPLYQSATTTVINPRYNED
ncbi:integrin beta-7 isoform X2 [Emys orbicularis]|uniref:integrin beta-7 isoform X2 n=1 Tax=Emys orbicularis TaxID=82168 RepID=UPI0031FE072F